MNLLHNGQSVVAFRYKARYISDVTGNTLPRRIEVIRSRVSSNISNGSNYFLENKTYFYTFVTVIVIFVLQIPLKMTFTSVEDASNSSTVSISTFNIRKQKPVPR